MAFSLGLGALKRALTNRLARSIRGSLLSFKLASERVPLVRVVYSCLLYVCKFSKPVSSLKSVLFSKP